MELISFSGALTALKAGYRVTRLGWNGKGMFVYRMPAASYPAQTRVAKAVFGDQVPYKAYFAIRGADGEVATWVPSSTDLDAEDWLVMEEPEHLTLPLDNGFLARLRVERWELNKKAQKLTAFLPTPAFLGLTGTERSLLQNQLEVMRRYAEILEAREVLAEVRLDR